MASFCWLLISTSWNMCPVNVDVTFTCQFFIYHTPSLGLINTFISLHALGLIQILPCEYQVDLTCYMCGSPDHLIWDCPIAHAGEHQVCKMPLQGTSHSKILAIQKQHPVISALKHIFQLFCLSLYFLLFTKPDLLMMVLCLDWVIL